jgi:hypothetical protein
VTLRDVSRVLLAAALAAALSSCGGGEDEEAKTPVERATPAAEEQVQEDSGGRLAIGITEPNPAFIHPAAQVPEPWAKWRDKVQAMRPHLYRLVVDWAGVTTPDGPQFDLARANPGCMRDKQPCLPYAGLRAQLEAIAAAQKAHKDRFEVLAVISGTPDGLAPQQPSGCERPGIKPRSRPPGPQGIDAYARLIEEVRRVAKEVGATIRYWSPWNEPNHPFFISPQRNKCSAKAKSASIEPYEALATAMRDTLTEDEELVLGELAGLLQQKPGYTSVGEFIRGLDKELVCASKIWTQHGYVGGPDPMDEVAEALATHKCETEHALWVTETGVGAPRRGENRAASPSRLRRACRLISKRLEDWFENPRIDAAVQYTVREDDRFPTGLVTTDLTKEYPAFDAWSAWAGDRQPTGEPPKSTC